ncbi:class II glutamine amidotransferase [Planktotalea sp.]|uniref:class II glutamine amidotransferase n=1 Tax=Planktotalea sp. TaxID=2029877 RepID=UPI003298FFA4
MCRLAAYLGPSISLSEVVIKPAHSLLEQSQHSTEAKVAVQGDGFGFAWYDGAKGPGLYRDVLPAWSDGNLLSLCHMIVSDHFLAHVRASTSGETSRVNCHPFIHGRWSFMHNGQVPDIEHIRRPLEAMLPDPLYAARRGTTDSELIFLLLLANGLNEDPKQAIETVLSILKEHSVYGRGTDAVRTTCVLSNGSTLYAFRHASDARAPTLYLEGNAELGWTLASEPLDADVKTWSSVAPDQLLTLTKKGSTLSRLHVGASASFVDV